MEYTEATSIVKSFGKLSPVGWWEYQVAPGQSEVRGNREGFIILRLPNEARVRVRVDVRATVKENFLSKFVHAVSGKWKPQDFKDMREVELPLYRAVPVTEHELRTKRWTPDFGDLIQGREPLDEGDKSITL